ncbi:YncE family protein [Chryseobacterium sp. T20]|uniref:YncE family protein n=1 Tax=Chryseobacterium sp. T20 TaxID=3395375 RepID=UPI0039BD4DFB
MKITKLLTVLFAVVLLFNISSCTNGSDEIEVSPITYQNGYFISNEGNYNSQGAKVTFVTRDLSLKQDDVYGYNNNEILGDVLQTIGLNGNKAYLVINNSNKIVVVDRYTFKKLGVITDQLDNPRGITFANNFIYVSNTNFVAHTQSITKYKASDYSFVSKISTTEVSDKAVEAGGNVFVQNASSGYGNKITYINTSNDTKTEITVPNGQIGNTISYKSNVYTISSTATDSYIYKISSTGALTPVITLTGIPSATNLQIDNDRIYFSSANKVYTTGLATPTVPASPLLTAADGGPYFTLYGFNVMDGKIFASDVKQFTQDSEMVVYSAATGNKILTFKTGGLGANGTYLNP